MHPRSKDLSISVAKEVFRELGAKDGFDYFSFPEKGTWRGDILSFRDCKQTSMIMKRRETASFPVVALFGDERLPGESICDLSDGAAAITVEDGVLHFRFDPFGLHLSNLNEAFRSWKPSPSWRLALMLYWLVPPRLRQDLMTFFRRIRGIGIRSADDLGLFGVSSNVMIHLLQEHLLQEGVVKRPSVQPLAVITHDIDYHFCQTEGRESIASAEAGEKVHSTWFFVPKSVQYSLDKRAVVDLAEKGHEIGLHGYAHDGRLALSNPRELICRIRKGKKILESCGVETVSFRSPWILRSRLLHPVLVSEGFMVDSSYPDSDQYIAVRRGTGVSYNRPYRPLVVREEKYVESLPIWEIPVTSPQDIVLVQGVGIGGNKLVEVWKRKADFCRDFGGVFVLLTHPYLTVKHMDDYVSFLRSLKSMGFRTVRMKDVISDDQFAVRSQKETDSMSE